VRLKLEYPKNSYPELKARDSFGLVGDGTPTIEKIF
jgi:hypothetical protein